MCGNCTPDRLCPDRLLDEAVKEKGHISPTAFNAPPPFTANVTWETFSCVYSGSIVPQFFRRGPT